MVLIMAMTISRIVKRAIKNRWFPPRSSRTSRFVASPVFAGGYEDGSGAVRGRVLEQGGGTVGNGRGDVRPSDVQDRIIGRGSMTSMGLVGMERILVGIGAIAILSDWYRAGR